jgi:hypothetical protein
MPARFAGLKDRNDPFADQAYPGRRLAAIVTNWLRFGAQR